MSEICYGESDYEVQIRVWCTSDGTVLREWTPLEYETVNPEQKIMLDFHAIKESLAVEAHCVEVREYFCKNRQGKKLLSFLKTVEY